jgi:hypothetical protein
MSTMISEVYDALLSAGAPDEKARKAAEVLANYDDRFAGIERRLGILTWQVGTLATVLAAVGVPSVWLLLRIAAKVGALG